MDARTLGSIALLVAALAGPAPTRRRGRERRRARRPWAWFTGGVVSINADGTIRHDPGNDGTWECTDRPGPGDAQVASRRLRQPAGPVRGRQGALEHRSHPVVRGPPEVNAPRPRRCRRPRLRAAPDAPMPRPTAKVPEPLAAPHPKAEGAASRSPPPRPGPSPRSLSLRRRRVDAPAPPRVSAVPCSGTACWDLAPTRHTCKVTNTGAKPLKVRAYLGERISENDSNGRPGGCSIWPAARRSRGSRRCTRRSRSPLI